MPGDSYEVSANANANDQLDVHHEEKKKNCCQKFLTFIFNPRTKEILGRTCASWAKIFIFYICYYAFLAGFFVAMISILLYGILSNTQPLLTGDQSLLRDGPGVGIFPQISTSDTIITVNYASIDTINTYNKDVNDLYKPYLNTSGTIACNTNNNSRPNDDIVNQPCRFDLNTLGKCYISNVTAPGTFCIYLRLNKVYGWLPQLTGNATSPGVQCTGQNAADSENMGTLSYYPTGPDGNGIFSHVFFPYLNQKNYQAPLVAVYFNNVATNVILLLQCQVLGVSSSAGSTSFELMIDTK